MLQQIFCIVSGASADKTSAFHPVVDSSWWQRGPTDDVRGCRLGPEL